MSITRAKINCKRCYELVDLNRNPLIKPMDKSDVKCLQAVEEKHIKSIYKNDQIYHARNEALKSLESAYRNQLTSRIFYFFNMEGLMSNLNSVNTIKEYLDLCKECDFKEPYIYNYKA